MGLLDFFIPIRTLPDVGEDTRSTVAFLIIGQVREAGDEALEEIHRRIELLRTDDYAVHYFGHAPDEYIAEVVDGLHTAVTEIPILDAERRSELQREVAEIVSLIEVIATRTLFRGTLFKGQSFIDSLDLRGDHVDIDRGQMWNHAQTALGMICDYMSFAGAAVFLSSDNDYTDLAKTAESTVPGRPSAFSSSLALSSYEEFLSLGRAGVTVLGRERPASLNWLSVEKLCGTPQAMLFAHEVIGDNLLVIVFGYDHDAKLSPFRTTVLFEAVQGKLLPFLENGLLSLELDDLMSETGHLLGRAWGKLVSGTKAVRKFIPKHVSDEKDERWRQLGLWAIEDGLTRLELIRENFYAFRGRRLGDSWGHRGDILTFDIWY